MLCANDSGSIHNGKFFFGRNRETMPLQGVLVQLHTAMAYVRWETRTHVDLLCWAQIVRKKAAADTRR